MEYGSLIVEYIVNKVVCFDSNGIGMFTNMHTSVVTNLHIFFITMHCMACRLFMFCPWFLNWRGCCKLPTLIFHFQQKNILSNVFLLNFLKPKD